MKMIFENRKTKKLFFIVGAILVIIIAAVIILVLNKKESYRNVIVNDHSGTVSLARNEKVMEMVKDMRLIPKDYISVGDESLLDLLVDSDKHIAVRSNTKFTVDAVGNSNNGLVTINVTEGKTYIKIDNALQPEDGFQVVTPNATISVRGTTFTVDYNPALGISRVECVEGKVNVISVSGEEKDLLSGDAVEVIDVMNASTLTQQEMDAINNIFTSAKEKMEEEEAVDTSKMEDELINDDSEADSNEDASPDSGSDNNAEHKQGQNYEYDEYGKYVQFNNHVRKYYDDNDVLIKEIRFNDDGTIQHTYLYEYDSNGNMIRLSHYNGEGILWAEYEYDSDGNLIRKALPRGYETVWCAYEYDAEGNVIRKITYNKDGSVRSESD